MLQIRNRSGAGAAAARAAARVPSAQVAQRSSSRLNSTSRRASADDEPQPTLPLPLPPASRPPSRPQSSAGGGGGSSRHEPQHQDPLLLDGAHLMADLAKAALSSAAAAVISAAPAHGAVAALPPPPAAVVAATTDALATPFSALGRELMLEGALHVSGPQLGSCLQRFGSSLQKAVVEPAPALAASPATRHGSAGLTSPRQRSLAQEEAVCLATPTEPAPVREQRLPQLPRMPTVTNTNANASSSSGLAEQIFLWRSASDSAEAAQLGRNGSNASSSPIAAAVRRLSRRAGLSPGGARALLEEAVGAGASYDAADDEAEIVACRRTVASIAARVGAAHATRRERRRLVVRARLAARGLLTGLSGGGGGGNGGSGGGRGADGAAA